MRTINKQDVFDYLDRKKAARDKDTGTCVWSIVYDFIIPEAQATNYLYEWLGLDIRIQSSVKEVPESNTENV